MLMPRQGVLALARLCHFLLLPFDVGLVASLLDCSKQSSNCDPEYDEVDAEQCQINDQ
jgi:hypothetical protein